MGIKSTDLEDKFLFQKFQKFQHFDIFRDFNFLSQNKLIFTMDITSLYTVILNEESLRALQHLLDQHTVKEPSSETLLRLAELVLLIRWQYYKKLNGLAMGTETGPSYANLLVGFIEHQVFIQYHGHKPELSGRYIDDYVGATSSTREELIQFTTAANSFHPALKYTWEISDTSLAFIDIKISCTSVYYKPTDSHSYLLYSSSYHHASRIQYLFHIFSDFVVYVATTLIFQKIRGNVPFFR